MQIPLFPMPDARYALVVLHRACTRLVKKAFHVHTQAKRRILTRKEIYAMAGTDVFGWAEMMYGDLHGWCFAFPLDTAQDEEALTAMMRALDTGRSLPVVTDGMPKSPSSSREVEAYAPKDHV